MVCALRQLLWRYTRSWSKPGFNEMNCWVTTLRTAAAAGASSTQSQVTRRALAVAASYGARVQLAMPRAGPSRVRQYARLHDSERARLTSCGYGGPSVQQGLSGPYRETLPSPRSWGPLTSVITQQKLHDTTRHTSLCPAFDPASPAACYSRLAPSTHPRYALAQPELSSSGWLPAISSSTAASEHKCHSAHTPLVFAK